jgi:DNA-binding NarL/FixJ family response regulator
VSKQLRVLLADDHPLFRDGLKALLASVVDAEVVGEAATGVEVVERTLELQPDVVLMDLHMPELNGIEATRSIVESSPHVGVLVLTMVEDDDAVFTAMRAGARGYLVKGSSQAEILHAIRAVGSGEAVFGPVIAQRLIEYFSASPAGPSDAFPQLTPREREVLELLAQGESNQAIARRFPLSQKTVRNHVSNIFTKLRVTDRAQAIVKARERPLTSEGRRSILWSHGIFAAARLRRIESRNLNRRQRNLVTPVTLATGDATSSMWLGSLPLSGFSAPSEIVLSTRSSQAQKRS